MKLLLSLILVLGSGCIGTNQVITELPGHQAEVNTTHNNPEVFGMSTASVTTHHCDVADDSAEDLTLAHLKNCKLVNSVPFAEGGEFGKSFGAAALGAGLGVGLGLQDGNSTSMNNSSNSTSGASSRARASSGYKKRY